MYFEFLQQNFNKFCQDLSSETEKMFKNNQSMGMNFTHNWMQSCSETQQKEGFAVFPFEVLKKQCEFFRNEIMYVINEKYSDDTDPNHCSVRFFFNYFFDFFTVDNFWFLNSQFWQEYLKTGGQNLLSSQQNFLRDLQKQRITTVNEEHFEIGKNIATTPGNVIFQNDIMEIIHYKPLAEKVLEVPLLIFPPFINKYYALDLEERISVIGKLLKDGQNIFLISWKNFPANKDTAKISLEDYVMAGVDVIDFILKNYGFSALNLMGYCVGGTITAIVASFLKATRKVNPINTITFVVGFLDFTNVGSSRAFVNEYSIDWLEQNIDQKKTLPGNDMFNFFSVLRAQEMIFKPMINNYLLGQEGPNFALLFWNNDSTNLPATMAKEYLRKCYIDDCLVNKSLKIKDITIDLKNLDMPIFFMSALNDHITPAKGIELSWYMVGKNPKNEFITVNAGHVAGAVLSIKKIYKFWRKKSKQKLGENWRDSAECFESKSWWDFWQEWIGKLSGKKVEIKNLSQDQNIFYEAPGKYVKEKC